MGKPINCLTDPSLPRIVAIVNDKAAWQGDNGIQVPSDERFTEWMLAQGAELLRQSSKTHIAVVFLTTRRFDKETTTTGWSPLDDQLHGKDLDALHIHAHPSATIESSAKRLTIIGKRGAALVKAYHNTTPRALAEVITDVALHNDGTIKLSRS